VGWFDVMEVPQGTGSGFVWDQDGHVVTNFHVIEDAQATKVTFAGQTSYRATLVGVAPEKDLAVLRISAPREKLVPILLGTSGNLQVGQRVFAIGNPFGLDQTLTTGIVSALGRSIQSATDRPIEGVIQTDAAINPGNSGGPLLDSAGRLIGVNTAIASPSGGSAGIGFAVPVDTVNLVVPQLIRHGKMVRPQLGVVLADDSIARRLGVEGALVLRVDPGSGAAAAGFRGTRRTEDGDLLLGDVIQSFGGRSVASSGDLLSALEEKKAGETVSIRYLRDGRPGESRVTLQGSP
jgi:S1-C subfamily serine protease